MPANDYASNLDSRLRDQGAYKHGVENTRAIMAGLKARFDFRSPEQQAALSEVEKLGAEAVHTLADSGLSATEFMAAHRATSGGR